MLVDRLTSKDLFNSALGIILKKIFFSIILKRDGLNRNLWDELCIPVSQFGFAIFLTYFTRPYLLLNF